MRATTWFITGSTSGIGRRVTEHLLRDGHRAAATARNPEQLADLTEHYKDQLWTAALDVTDGQAVRTIVDRAFAEFDRIEVVFSNARYGLMLAATLSAHDRAVIADHVVAVAVRHGGAWAVGGAGVFSPG
jgi:NADP-dependent 3-hydroxy acid dehydrogenase YdfG